MMNRFYRSDILKKKDPIQIRMETNLIGVQYLLSMGLYPDLFYCEKKGKIRLWK